jgi:hypothetical protein
MLIKNKPVIKVLLLALALILTLTLAACSGQRADSDEAKVKDGLLELTGCDFSQAGNVSLDGDWAFYWGELLSPGEFEGIEPTGYYAVPSYWTKYRGLSLPSYGEATYRLVVKTDGLPRVYGIRTPEFYTEYSLWINGELLNACGSFADEEAVYLHPGSMTSIRKDQNWKSSCK